MLFRSSRQLIDTAGGGPWPRGWTPPARKCTRRTLTRVIRCFESCVRPGETEKYPPITVAEHYLGKLMKAGHSRRCIDGRHAARVSNHPIVPRRLPSLLHLAFGVTASRASPHRPRAAAPA